MKAYKITIIFVFSTLIAGMVPQPIVASAQTGDSSVILTSNTILKDIVENLVGNLVEVKSLYPIGGRSWGQEGKAWPVDLKVGLVVYEDGEKVGIPQGVSALILPSQTPITALDILSPAYTHLHVQKLSRRLIEAYPDFFEEITFNTNLFTSDLTTVDSLIRKGFDTLDLALPFIMEGNSLFPFCQHYGLTCLSMEDERPALAALLVESTSSPRAIQALSDETTWPIVGQVYTRSLSKADGPASTYLDLIRSNATVLQRGLQTEITLPSEPELPSWVDWRMILFIGVLALITGVMALRVVRKL